LVGFTLALLACALCMAPSVGAQLAEDSLVVRALGATLAMAGVMLGRVGLRAAAGLRRIAVLALAIPLVLAAIALLFVPTLAVYPYTRGWQLAVPWGFGIPAIYALLLGRWRVS
jgi:hypothetical protein